MLSPPLEPKVLLKLHQWLKEVAHGDVRRIKASWAGDTVMSMVFREPVALRRLLADMPEVAVITDEPYTDAGGETSEDQSSPRERRAGAPKLPPKQYRLAMRPA